MKQRSLLSKTLSQFLACAIAIFALTAPLFYLLTKQFYAEDMIDIIESVKSGQGIPPLDLERDIVAGMMLQFLLIFLVISISLFITLRFVTRRLWQPFDDTLQKAETFNLAQSDVPRFAETDIREFSRLNRSLAQLMAKDKDVYRIQKEFTENASHELQTPLAVTRSKLDLLMQEKLEEQAMGIVADLYSLNTRMSHLNRNLLLLAKIENAQYAERERVDPATCIRHLLPTYDALQEHVRIFFKDERKQASLLNANTILLECLLNNLVVNAIRHTHAPDGEILLFLTKNRLEVSNPADGPALPASDLFRRFRSSDVQSTGNGLGLSIVKAICDYHGWTVGYRFENGRHLFAVNFKKENGKGLC